MTIFAGTDAAALRAAADVLARGGLVGFPTETVYGLGARADDDGAVAGIYAAKGRPADHPLIVHVASRDAVDLFAASVDDGARRLMDACWPGPLTLILPRRPGHGEAAAAGQDSIGLRMPAHPVAQALLQAAARRGVAGVAAPSANRFGRISPTTAAHVAAEFGEALLVLDGGACPVGIESAIVDCTRPRPALLRPGQLDRLQLERLLGQSLAAPDAASPRAPGTLESHYAPQAPLRLFDTAELRLALDAAAPGTGGLAGAVAVYSRLVPAASKSWMHRPMPADAAAAAHELFAVLREFDGAGVAAIWVEQPPAGAAWDGVRDRLQRAAA
ncbi:Threonylcarbamoyl-AMP synthase [Rubrivivax sp. A210]|uniref:L-threonylcarbamoyladenylate synthase n=1 Tax=Rubrivivax sp. A210 TaxID=2772301 RepID=UPI001917C039|nr:L-threonylcarbamoyladenylate synthase [Rubrivivax sp. A210]CAD5374180.1 Threonylcarbamoyl-AMP synthase [Rubrivivax sp. A210]